LPFVDFDPTDGRLLAFLDLQWADKMKAVVDVKVPRTKRV